MSNIIDKILVSGVTYDLPSGGSGSTTVELTQAEYDALVSGGTVDPDTYYIITDATPQDMSQYWTSAQTNSAITKAVSGVVETSAITSSVTSASTDSQIPSAKAVYDAIPQGGGGKAVTGGTNISVTTGETADTINCTIPAFFHSNTVKGDINIGSNSGVDSDFGLLVIGRRVQSRGNPYFQYSIGIGVQPDNSNNYCQLYGQNSVGIGRGFKIGSDSYYSNGINNAIAIGHNATSRNDGDITLGANATASGNSSVAIGSGATADGVEYKMNLNNQIKVTPSNQVYISNSANTSTYCLQEKIETTEAALGGLKLVKLTQSAYDALSPDYDSNTLYVIVN